MKSFVFSVTLLIWVGMGVWMYAQAQTDTITATVSVSTYSVSAQDGSIAYGALSTSATQDTFALSDSQYVENTGNETAVINILGATTDAWDMTATIGTDEFRHRYATAGDDSAWVTLTDSYQLLTDSLTSSATQALDLEIQVPSSTNATSTQNANLTVQATS